MRTGTAAVGFGCRPTGSFRDNFRENWRTMETLDSKKYKKIVRKHARFKLDARAVFKMEGDAERGLFYGKTKNLSLGGVCLEIDEDREKIVDTINSRSTVFQVSLNLAERGGPTDVYQVKTSWIRSSICWLLTPSSDDVPVFLGLRFEDLAETDAKKIDTFTTSYLDRKKEDIFNDRIEQIMQGRDDT